MRKRGQLASVRAARAHLKDLRVVRLRPGNNGLHNKTKGQRIGVQLQKGGMRDEGQA